MKHPEHDIQCAIVNYLRLNKVFCFAVPNGGLRNLKTAVFLKKEGATAGVSDLIILLKNKCVFVEIKTKTGRQSEEQKVFQQAVELLGFEYHIWRSLDDAIKFVRDEGLRGIISSPLNTV